MQNVAQLLEGPGVHVGQQVVAWGFGRMRPGTLVSVGPKNARVRLVAGADGRTYVKAVRLPEVWAVEDGASAAVRAETVNQAATVPAERRGGRAIVSSVRAEAIAAAWGEPRVTS
jgi:hypothetical protein